jgi:type III secretion system TyeA family effector delivery regulator
VKSSLDDVIGTYQGRKISAGGKNPSDAGLDLNDPTKFFESGTETTVKSQSRQGADAKAQKMRAAIGKMFPEMQNSAGLLRFAALLRRLQRENNYNELAEEMEKIFPDPSVRFGVIQAMAADLGGGGGGDNSQEALREHLQEYGARLEQEHGPAIAAGNNIAPVLNELVQSRPQDAGNVRDFYRQAVLGYQSPSQSYRHITGHLGQFSGLREMPGAVPVSDGPEFERHFSATIDFLASALAADLAATRPSGEPAQLGEVVDGLQQVRFLGNAHNNCRDLLSKFHKSTNNSVPVAPFRLMTDMLDSANGGRVSDADFVRMASEFNLPPLEPTINFLTQFRDVVRGLPPRAYDKPETRERVLEAMQKAIDHSIDEEEVALG